MDIDEIYDGLISDVESKTGVRVNAGGDMALRLRAVAAELASLWAHVEWVKRQGFPQTATGELLDKHAAVRDLERRKGSKARGSLRFETSSAAASTLTVPAGPECMRLGGTEFVTCEEGTIEEGESFCVVEAEAAAVGSMGNVPADIICQMVLAPVGIARCRNTDAFKGGADIEDDDSLRSRIMASYSRLPNGSNAAYYEAEALNTDGVTAVKVFPRRRGLGTVDVVVASKAFPPEESLLKELEDKFNAEREICVDVKVLAPEAVTVDIQVVVDVEPGAEAARVRAKVHDELEKLFDGRLLGKNLLLARLGSVIFNVEGVSNYVIVSPSADMEIQGNQLPVAGEITVTGR